MVMVSYDYFAFVKNKHKEEEKAIKEKATKNKSYKLQNRCKNRCKIKLNNKTDEDLSNALSNIAKEPIKTHILFKELEGMMDLSWRSVMFNFYNCKLSEFNNGINERSICFSKILQDGDLPEFKLKKFYYFRLKFKSPFFTASENKFYSIDNPIAKERPTGLPILKGSSLKGALRRAAVDVVEEELLNKNYGNVFDLYKEKEEDEILSNEEERDDRFFFKKRARLVMLFGNEKSAVWFTFKSLLATGGIKDAEKMNEVLQKITGAFERYLKSRQIVNSEGSRKGRLIFEDLYFTRVSLDVITPLHRIKRTPEHGPIFYEVVPKGESLGGKIIWFPFDLIAKGKDIEEIEKEWETDKNLISEAFERLRNMGIGAKTKNNWGRFDFLRRENNGTKRFD